MRAIHLSKIWETYEMKEDFRFYDLKVEDFRQYRCKSTSPSAGSQRTESQHTEGSGGGLGDDGMSEVDPSAIIAPVDGVSRAQADQGYSLRRPIPISRVGGSGDVEEEVLAAVTCPP